MKTRIFKIMMVIIFSTRAQAQSPAVDSTNVRSRLEIHGPTAKAVSGETVIKKNGVGATGLGAAVKAEPGLEVVSAPPLQPAELRDKLLGEIQKFSEKENLTSADEQNVVRQLKNVIRVDPLDPSRTSLELIMNSYLKNKTVYRSARELLTADEKKKIDFLLGLIDRLHTQGNG